MLMLLSNPSSCMEFSSPSSRVSEKSLRWFSVNMDDDMCADAASTLESIKRAKIGDMRGRKYTLVGKTAHLDFNCRGLNCQDDLTVTAP